MLAENVLRKHVSIIHSYSMMSSLQRKIFNVLLHEAVNKNNVNDHHESIAIECIMSMSNLRKAVNFNSNNTQYFRESIDTLASINIDWNLLKDRVPNNISFLNLRVMHGPPTFYKNGTFNFSLHKFLLNFIGSPEIYGTIDVDLQAEFESKYSHSLYENSTRFVNMQKGRIINLDTFRKLLGVGEEKYSEIRELTRNVIKPATEEVNDRCEFLVNLHPVRLGKKISGYEIQVNPKKHTTNIKQNKVIDEEYQKISEEIYNVFGKISNSVLDNVLKKYPYEYIYQKITYTKKQAKKEKTGLYPIAYFISAIKHDYKSTDDVLDEKNEMPKLSNESIIWNNKLRELRGDVEHWKRFCSHFAGKSNEENLKGILRLSEEKLHKHLSQRPLDFNDSEGV